MSCARETTLTFFIKYLSTLTSKVYLLVNFFQSYMSPLFFIGLLSYLVETKSRTSRHMVCKRDNSHISIMYLSTLTSKVYLLVNLFFQSDILPLFFSGLLSYLVGIKKRTSRQVWSRETTLAFFVMYLSPLKHKSCAGHNSNTVEII